MEDVAFEWKPVRMTTRSLEIQLTFTDPDQISVQIDPNFIEAIIWDPTLFISVESGFSMAPEAKAEKKLPSQVDKIFGEIIESIGVAINAGGKGTLLFVAILNILLQFSMNTLLSYVRSLSFITHFFLMQVMYPAIAVVFFSQILEFVTFDIIPTDDVYSYIFDFGDDSAYSDEADQVGYGSRFILVNIGSIGIFFTLTILQQIFFNFLYFAFPQGRVRNWALR